MLLFLIALVLMITLHEAGHGIMARLRGLPVTHASLGFGPVLLRKEWRGTEYRLSLLPLGGYVKIPGMRPGMESEKEYAHLPQFYEASLLTKTLVLSAGVAVNLITGFAVLMAVYLTGFPTYHQDLITGSSKAGIAKGAQVTSWNSHDPRDAAFVPVLDKNECANIGLDGKPEQKFCQLKGLKLARSGSREWGHVPGLSVADSAKESAKTAEYVVTQTVKVLVSIPVSEKSRHSITSIVGIVSGADQGSVQYLWLYIALVSMALGLFNLLPLLPLDGGHIVVAVYERLRGCTMAEELYMTYTLIGWVLMLSLFYIGLSNDLGH